MAAGAHCRRYRRGRRDRFRGYSGLYHWITSVAMYFPLQAEGIPIGQAILSSVRRTIFPDVAIDQRRIIREEVCRGTTGGRQRSFIRRPFAAGIDRTKKRDMASREAR